MSENAEHPARPELTARWTSGKQFALVSRGHRVVCDQPAAKGGADEGPTPPELLAGALAACVGVYVLPFFERRGIPVEGLAIVAHWEGAPNPARVGLFELEIVLPEAAHGKLTEQDREILLRAAESCYVHHTLQHAPEVVVHIAG